MKHFVKVNGYLVQLEKLDQARPLALGEWALLVVGVVAAYVLYMIIFCS